MAHTLKQPYTEEERINFIVEYNHNQGMVIEETETALYALEIWEELMGDEVVDNKEAWEAEQAQKEKERIAKLKLTKREVFLGLYQAKGVIPEMIKAQITDPAVLIEFEYANDYYRGNPLIDIVGATLGITPEQLDKFFETNDYTYLLVKTDEESNTTEIVLPEEPIEESQNA